MKDSFYNASLKIIVLVCATLFLHSALPDDTIKLSDAMDKIAFITTSNRNIVAPVVRSGDSTYAIVQQAAIWDSPAFVVSNFSGQSLTVSAIEIPQDRRGLARIKIEAEFPSCFKTRPPNSKPPQGAVMLISTNSHGVILFTPAVAKNDKIEFQIPNPDYVPGKGDKKKDVPSKMLNQDVKIQYRAISDFDFSMATTSSGILLGLVANVGMNEKRYLFFEYDDDIKWRLIDAKTFYKEGTAISSVKAFVPRYIKAVDMFYSRRYRAFELTPEMPEELINWAIYYNEHVKDMPFAKTKVKKGASLEGIGSGDQAVQNKRLEICARLANFAKNRVKSVQNLQASENRFMRNEAKRVCVELENIVDKISNDKKPDIKFGLQSDKETLSFVAENLKPLIEDAKARLGKIKVKGRQERAKGNHPDWREKGRIYGVSRNKEFTKFSAAVLSTDKKETLSAAAEKQKDGSSAFSLWLPPGKYNIVISASGFEPVEIKNLEVKTDNDLEINLDFEKPEEE